MFKVPPPPPPTNLSESESPGNTEATPQAGSTSNEQLVDKKVIKQDNAAGYVVSDKGKTVRCLRDVTKPMGHFKSGASLDADAGCVSDKFSQALSEMEMGWRWI